MFKSIGKQVVILKNPESKIFEEAIFIVKDGIHHPQRDMLEECERIINEQSLKYNKKKVSKKVGIVTVITSIIVFVLLLIMIYFNLL